MTIRGIAAELFVTAVVGLLWRGSMMLCGLITMVAVQ